MTTIAESLSKLAENLEYEDLSKAVIDRTKYLAMDFIGFAERGNSFESNKPIHQFIKNLGGKGEGVIIGNKDLHTLPQYAALAN